MASITYSLIIRHKVTSADSSGNKSTSTQDYLVDPLDGVSMTRGMDCVPTKLQFSVLKDAAMDFTEGDSIVFQVNGTNIFQGILFTKQRGGSSGIIKVTAYDQIIYMVKNYECYVYNNKTANELLLMICNDYQLTHGDFANTVYKVSHIDDNKTLADIISYALDATLINTQGHYYYHIYDDAGKLMLVPQSSMKLDLLIDKETMSDYTYKSSIDNDTYNMVKVIRKAPGANNVEKLVTTGLAVDNDHISQWGRLQYVMRPEDKDLYPLQFAQYFLALHDCKTREIKLRGVLGDVRVRGGSLVYVRLSLGDINLDNYMLVTNVTHHFNENYHSMDIDLMYAEEAGKYSVTYDNDAAVLKTIEDAKAKTSMVNGKKSGTTSSSLVDAGFSAADGRVPTYGGNGCVDTACFIGSYYNTDIAEEYDNGVSNVDVLCSDMSAKGYVIETYDGSANKGDILVYGSRSHVTVADGAGGCYGNSTKLEHEYYYSNCNSAYDGSSAPTEIIRVG